MSARIMSARSGVRILICWLLLAVPALAQGFAGLGRDASGFAVPQPGVELSFPRDHGAHPDFRIEWWYLTMNLKGADGRDYGAQWTLFRSGLARSDGQGWQSATMWMGHAAVTSAGDHRFAERLARGGIGQAGVTLDPFMAEIDDWQMKSRAAAGQDAIAAIDLKASGKDFAYALKLDATGPLVRHGAAGYSRKSAEGQASYYYSQPSYTVSGTVHLPEGDVVVTGEGWLDHEWSSQPLSAGQTGWDWFSLHFDDGSKLMGFRLRDGGAGYTSATWIRPDGEPEPQPPGALKLTPLDLAEVAGRSIPTSWRIELPAHGLDVTTHALNPQSWMTTSVPYWEGPASVTGTHKGQGYVEMTGYE